MAKNILIALKKFYASPINFPTSQKENKSQEKAFYKKWEIRLAVQTSDAKYLTSFIILLYHATMHFGVSTVEMQLNNHFSLGKSQPNLTCNVMEW